MVTARSFAMALNRLADRKLDANNPRTAGRHLPARILSVNTVAAFAAISAAGFVASTLLFLPNRLPLALAVPVLLFLAGYSYTKRFTSLAHFWLGTALALSPIAAWIAIRGEAVIANPTDLLPAITLGAAVLTWVAGFDIIYACQDYESDRQARLHSIPVAPRHPRRSPTRRRLPLHSPSPCSPACRSCIHSSAGSSGRPFSPSPSCSSTNTHSSARTTFPA